MPGHGSLNKASCPEPVKAPGLQVHPAQSRRVCGFATGDIVHATVPKGRIDGIGQKHLRRVQRNDGHGYFFNAVPPRPEGRGHLARSR